ncbi:helix-turn-helix domain-containing protein, partial [Flavihumibacter solisilvae]
ATHDVFFICPGDHHYFDIMECTRFASIKFTDNYFHKHTAESIILHSPQVVMQHKQLKETKPDFSPREKTILRNAVENIVSYYDDPLIATSPFVFYQILSILGLTREVVGKSNETSSMQLNVPLDEQIISYIHQHIYSPAMIAIKSISNHFNISSAYFSTFFKKNYGDSFRSYVNKYRVSLIQNRLRSNQVTLKQIADEFGFTDESHLSHFFKNQTNITPGMFRQSAYGTCGGLANCLN